MFNIFSKFTAAGSAGIPFPASDDKTGSFAVQTSTKKCPADMKHWKHLARESESKSLASMSSQRIEQLDAIMKDSLFVTNIVLLRLNELSAASKTDTKQSTYHTYFNDTQYLPSVIFVFEELRQFITSYLKRENALANLRHDDRFNPNAIIRLIDGDDANVATAKAYFIPEVNGATLNFGSMFWANPLTLADWHQLRLEPHRQVPQGTACLTLIHELVHLVSYFCSEQFLAVSDLKISDLPVSLCPVKQRTALIADVYLTAIATEEEKAILQTLQAKGVIADTDAQYVENARALPHLKLGAIGALLNAESHGLLALELTMQYLAGVYQTVYSTDPDAQKVLQEWDAAVEDYGMQLWGFYQRYPSKYQHTEWPTFFGPLSNLLSEETLKWLAKQRESLTLLLESPLSPSVVPIEVWWHQSAVRHGLYKVFDERDVNTFKEQLLLVKAKTGSDSHIASSKDSAPASLVDRFQKDIHRSFAQEETRAAQLQQLMAYRTRRTSF